MPNATPIILGSVGMPVADVGAGGRGMPVEIVTSGNATPAVLAAGGTPISQVGGGGPVYADIGLRSSSFITYGTRPDTTIAPPAGIVNGDILIAQFMKVGGTPLVDPTPPAGFAEFGTATSVIKSLEGRMYLYWKRANNESGNYVWAHTADSTAVWMGAFSGCKASGVPLGATSNNSGVDASDNVASVGLGITTTAPKSWLLFFEHDWGDQSNNLTPPPGMTEQYEAVVIYNARELRATAGPTGDRTMNNNSITNNPWAARMVELLAATV